MSENYQKIRNLLCNIKQSVKNSNKIYYDVFQILTSYLVEKFTAYLDHQKKSNRGAKRKFDLNEFFKCLFLSVDNSLKQFYIEQISTVKLSSYKRYLTLLTKSQIMVLSYQEIIHLFRPSQEIDYCITDSFTFKSMDGSDHLGKNPTDRGRQGGKTSIICDQDLIVHGVICESANTHDCDLLIPTIQQSMTPLRNKKCLGDKGYAGQKYISKVRAMTGVHVIAKPRRTRNPLKMTHYISSEDAQLLKEKRSHIERLNQNLRNFRSIHVKYTKKMATYVTYLFTALLCTTCYSLSSKI